MGVAGLGRSVQLPSPGVRFAREVISSGHVQKRIDDWAGGNYFILYRLSNRPTLKELQDAAVHNRVQRLREEYVEND